MRLDKFIANQSTLSRSEAVNVIKNGKVSVDEKIVRDPKTQINEEKNIISLNGEKLIYKEFIYLMLNKPTGYISSTDDPRQKTVLELLPEIYSCRKPFTSGRLDIDTTGLVLLTDDGAWSHNITSPKKKCFKTYIVQTFLPLSKEAMHQLETGVFLDGDDKITEPALIREINPCEYELKISEGRFHQVKRMMLAVGNKVVKLHRAAIGDIRLDSQLKLGESRELTNDEISFFR